MLEGARSEMAGGGGKSMCMRPYMSGFKSTLIQLMSFLIGQSPVNTHRMFPRAGARRVMFPYRMSVHVPYEGEQQANLRKSRVVSYSKGRWAMPNLPQSPRHSLEPPRVYQQKSESPGYERALVI